MGEQVTHSYILLAVLSEFRDVALNRVIQPDLSLIEEPHDAACGCKDFRQRRQIEDGLHRHRLTPGRDRTVSERLAIDNLAFVAYDDHRSRSEFLADCVIENAVENRQPRICFLSRGENGQKKKYEQDCEPRAPI